MNASKQHSIPRSWIPPSISWISLPGIFGVEISINDPSCVEFVAAGWLDLEVYSAVKKVALVLANVTGRESLVGQLEAAIWDPRLLKPAGNRLRKGDTVRVFCHGVFCLPGSQSVLVLVGRNAPTHPDAWVSSTLKTNAKLMQSAHLTQVSEYEEQIRIEKEERTRFGELSPDLKSVLEKFEGLGPRQPEPVLCAVSLLPHLPKAIVFRLSSTSAPEAASRAACTAIESSGWLPSRDGSYAGIPTIRIGRKTLSVVTWEPHQGLPSYPEIRWAVQRRLPRSLHNPRAVRSERPEFDSGLRSVDETNSVLGVMADGSDLLEALDGLHLDDRDYRNRVHAVRKAVKDQGFEAIAWFQPYHVWTEETWGIYFDARKLDDLALSLLDDFRAQRIGGSESLAAFLAFGLTYAHEMFHARVEAALSWMEINAQQPRHLRYDERVYQALRETPDWLEEALANWSAWDWFKAPGIQSLVTRIASNAEGLERVVEASLDLAPPGYQEWRLGHEPGTWRTFANQLSTGNPKLSPTVIGLPLESALTGPLPYDFQPADIPLRFVGPGAIADRLQSHPATFNVPPRRELERALKFFDHTVDPSSGKGSHEKWTGPDHRSFIVPTRDPVSRTVFTKFLDYIGIDKATYLRQVRPNI